MTEFYVVALLLSLLACLFPLSALWLKTNTNKSERFRRLSNVAVYEEELAALERSGQSSELVEQQRQALQRRLLEESVDEDPSEALEQPKRAPWLLVAFIGVFVPVTAFAAYSFLGASAELAISERWEALETVDSPEQYRLETLQLIDELEALLAKKQDKPHYLMLLGRSYMQSQNFSKAEQAFAGLMADSDNDPVVSGLYVQARYMAAGRQLDASAEAIAQEVLNKQPFNGTVLGLLGMVHFERQNYAEAVSYWQRLQQVIDPQSNTAQMIARGIAHAEAQLGTAKDGSSKDGSAEVVSISVDVTLGADMKPAKGASVFVYARAAGGSKMPLAVAKIAVEDLPARVVLDDSMAMAPGMNLSSASQVEVIARISNRGIANAGSGDLQGQSKPMALAEAKQLSLIIDRVIP